MTNDAITEPRLMIPRLLSDHDYGALSELGRRLEATGRIVESERFVQAVRDRELLCPTFLGQGVALPHARGGEVQQLSLAVGLSPGGIRWGRDLADVVQVVFLCAIPVFEVNRYLQLLAELSRWIRDEDRFQQFCASRQPEAMIEALSRVLLNLDQAGDDGDF
jgi:mannitol/fructose-specific phosphotransferase system IIA component (Ntr-type)